MPLHMYNIRITGKKAGKTKLKIKGTGIDGEEVVKSIFINIKEKEQLPEEEVPPVTTEESKVDESTVDTTDTPVDVPADDTSIDTPTDQDDSDNNPPSEEEFVVTESDTDNTTDEASVAEEELVEKNTTEEEE